MSDGPISMETKLGGYLHRLRRRLAPKAETPRPVPLPMPGEVSVAIKESLAAPVDEASVAKPKRGVVISNCQCHPLAAWLTVLSADRVFDFWGVHIIDPDHREAAIADFVAKARAEYDVILAIPLSEDYQDLATARIADTFAGIPLIRISNIFFSGFHPDLTYIGGLNQRVVGPLGDYHSKLAIHGFMTGLSVNETRSLFCAEAYARLGYFDEFSTSLETLKARDGNVDVPVTRFLEAKLRSDLCFYSVNHPTPPLFSAYAADIMGYLVERGLAQHSGFPADPSLCAENLAGSVIFPIYPEIAAYHGAPHIGSHTFKPDGHWVNPISLERFLTLEFEVFDGIGRETLALSHAAQIIAVNFKVLQS